MGRMIWAAALHCMVLWLLQPVKGQLTQQQKRQIVDLHNMYRSMVKPEAANMLRMKWDEKSSMVAEKYASECIWEHNPNIQNIYGENLYLTTGTLNISKGLANWFNEYVYYNYDDNTCPDDQMCGHYTQMVWAETTAVGCASRLCQFVTGYGKKGTILVCNYKPPGNIEDEKPYLEGKPCSMCPINTLCVNKTCGQFPTVPVKPSSKPWSTNTPKITTTSKTHQLTSVPVKPNKIPWSTNTPKTRAVSSVGHPRSLTHISLIMLLFSGFLTLFTFT